MTDSYFLTLTDYAALALFIVVWIVHGMASDGRIVGRISLTAAMNAQREAWMRTMAKRELRMIDTSIMVGLQQGTAFFASSALIAVGGCFALLGASDHVLNVMSELSLSETPLRSVFEIKVLGLITILAFAFFKFGWSYRLFNYCSILIGAVPMVREGAAHGWEMEVALGRAIKMNILAGRHFNAGLRAVFFSIGYLGWFIDPRVFALTTILLFAVLLRRQFFSAAREAVIASDQDSSGPGKTESILPEKR